MKEDKEEENERYISFTPVLILSAYLAIERDLR